MKNCRLPKPQIERTNDPKLKSWYRHNDRLFVQDGLLVRSIGNQHPCPNCITIVPTALRETILNAGHLGITPTEERVRKRFYWPGTHNDIKMYVKNV